MTFAVSNTGPDACSIGAPTELRWYDTSGNLLPIETTAGEFLCHPAVPCTYTLAGTGQFHAVPLEVVILVANPGNYNPSCPTPYYAAHQVGLEFPQGELRIGLNQDIELETCHPQGSIYSVEAAVPTAPASGTPVILDWQQAVDLFGQCQVKSVTQTHSLDLYIVLSDGTEVHAQEPEIDLVFSVADLAATHCRSITIGTE